MKTYSVLANQTGMLKTTRRWMLILFIALLTGMIMGCNTDGESGGGGGDSDTPSGQWTLVSAYYYYYNGSDQLIREVDDNNASGATDAGDITWLYDYDNDDLRTGYLSYNGNDFDPSGVGTYFYDTNDCNDRLEEETPQGTNRQVWTYDVNADCTRNSYHYEGDNPSEDGIYTRNGDGFVTRLKLDSGEYWDYDVDDDGKRLRYDYYEDSGENVSRNGVYYYDNKDRLDQLNSYEKR
jgi:hypothetical protein